MRWPNRIGPCLAVGMLTGGLVAAGDDTATRRPVPAPKPAAGQDVTPSQRYQRLQEEYEKVHQPFEKKRRALLRRYREAGDDEEKDEIRQEFSQILENHPAKEFAPRFLELARANPNSDLAVRALIWVVRNARAANDFGSMQQALQLLAENHADSRGLREVLPVFAYSPGEAESFLRAVIEKNPDHETKGLALYVLAKRINRRHRRGSVSREERAEFRTLLQRIKDRYADVDYRGKSLKEHVAPILFELTRLQIGMVAPEIEGEDVNGDPMKLSDYRGRVVVLDFWGDW